MLEGLRRFDTYPLERLNHRLDPADAGQGASRGGLFGAVGGDHDRDHFIGRAAALAHGLDRDFLMLKG